jgi:membrane-associated protein
VTLADVVETLTDAVARTGPYAPVVLSFASFIEYVFPPFPGDALVLLGAWYAVQGLISWPATFVAVTAGAIAGATVDWYIGRALGPRLAARARSRGEERAAQLARFEASYRRWGPWFLAANRFLPGVRAFLFVAAGACRVPYREVLFFGGLSAALWNALLLSAGAFLARNLDQLVRLFDRYTTVAWGVVAAAILVFVIRVVRQRRREPAQ